MSGNISIITGLLVLVFIIYRQRRIRLVRESVSITLPLVLAILGLSNFEYYLRSNPLTMTSMVSIIVSLLFLAVGMGAARAFTIRIWSQNGDVFRQATWLTISLWIVSIALHIAVDQIGNTGESTLLIYYAITLFVQRSIVYARAKKVLPGI
jgi:hypothetical protein